ncbi:neurotactin-like [Centruroides sculpturatus]|uniref:neurotactin-like n=1 Tax=Centruroides sculpturatus TaxID=218467 RepID=UPI000C6D9453|nr:neurotactin-like [Centruroides sculpturatus]
MGVEAEDQDVSSQPEEETRESKSPDKEQILSEELEKQESTKDEVDGEKFQDSVTEDKEEEPEEEETENCTQKSPKLKLWNRLFKRGKKLKIQEADLQDTEAGTELLVHTKENEIQNSSNNKDEDEMKKNRSGTDVTLTVTDDQEGAPEDDNKDRKTTDQSRAVRRQVIFGSIFVLFVIVAITLASILGNKSSSEPEVRLAPVTHVDCGAVQGVIEHGVYVFRGIPYALPPVGDLRWKPSEMVSDIRDCWSDTYNAMYPENLCYQAPIKGRELNFSEDCLYLDVITPEPSRAKQKPVVVYIPGSSLLGYTEEDIDWRPHPRLAKEKDVVFVILNYRTNIFGFLTLDLLSAQERSPISGNYGLHDQLAALKWVQRNIDAFGGNPEKVTIFAHNSAAIALLSSRKSHGLFHRVWLTGFPAKFTNKTLNQTNEENSEFLKNIKCETLSCMMNKTEEEVFTAIPKFWLKERVADLPEENEEPNPTLIVHDGIILYDSIFNMWKEGDLNQVPIVLGSTAQELAPKIEIPDKNTWNWTQFSDYVTKHLDNFGTNLTETTLNFYKKEGSNPEIEFATMVSDIRITCPIHSLSEMLSEFNNSGIYTYVVDYVPSAPLKWSDEAEELQMAIHGIDVVAIFGLLSDYIQLNEKDKAYQSVIQDIFYNFVRNGEPYANGSPLKSTGYVNTIKQSMTSYPAPYKNCYIWKPEDLDYKYGYAN